MNEIIRVENLNKTFKDAKAVDDLSFGVNRGEVFGFLGQNGAGKSTTIRMMLTLVKPDAGSISIFGKDVMHHRKHVLKNLGALIEKPDLYKYLTAIQNLRLMAQLSGLKPLDKDLLNLLEKLGIGQRAHSAVKTFSQGMRQRLGIACALVHNPELIILDEPTNGLDPQGITDIRNLILHLSREEGKTIFVSSHLLSEIELVADSMLIIHKGKKIAEGRVSELLHPSDTLVQIRTTDDAGAVSIIKNSAWAELLQPGNAIMMKMHRDRIPELAVFMVGQGISIMSLEPRHSLENYFLSLTTPGAHANAYQN